MLEISRACTIDYEIIYSNGTDATRLLCVVETPECRKHHHDYSQREYPFVPRTCVGRTCQVWKILLPSACLVYCRSTGSIASGVLVVRPNASECELHHKTDRHHAEVLAILYASYRSTASRLTKTCTAFGAGARLLLRPTNAEKP